MTRARVALACLAFALLPVAAGAAVVADTSDRMAHITVEATGKLIADGKTPLVVTIHGEDAAHASLANANVDVTVLTGNAVLQPVGPLDPQRPHDGHRLTGATDAHGNLQVRVIAGLVAGTVQLAIVSGPVTITDDLFAKPNARKAIVTGLASGGFGAVPGSTDGNDVFDNGGSRRGRVALFGTGDIGGGAVGTFAYETANDLYPNGTFGPNVDNPDARSNPTYGDSSLRSTGAESQNHLFARIEKDQSSIQYGAFTAQTGGSGDVGSFSALLSGINLKLADKHDVAQLGLFDANTNIAYGRAEFTPLGLSTAGSVLQPRIIIGSDIVTVNALSRTTGAVISSTQLTRNVDYVIDYPSGMLRFLNIPLPYDAYFNPQIVLVQYEYEGIGTGATTAGGRLRVGTDHLYVGAGYVNQSASGTSFTLFSQTAGGTVGGVGWTVSHAASTGGLGVLGAFGDAGDSGNGDAFHAGLTAGGKAGRFTGSYDSTSNGYANPFGGLTTPGLTNYRVAYELGSATRGDLTLEYDGQITTALGNDATQQNLGLHARAPIGKRLTLTAGVDVHTSSGQNGDAPAPVLAYPGLAIAPPLPGTTYEQNIAYAGGESTQADLGLDWKATSNLDLSAERRQNIGGLENPTQPGETNAQLTYRMSDTGSLFVRELWSDVPTLSFATSSIAATGTAQATHSMMVGFDRAITPATTVESSYVVNDTASGIDAYALFGVKQTLKFSHFLTGDAFVQTGNGSGGDGTGQDLGGFGVYGADLAYANGDRMHATASAQVRTGFGAGSTLNVGAAGALSTEISLLANVNATDVAGYAANQDNVGLAWRPSNDRRGAGLLAYERTSGDAYSSSASTNVVSYDQLYRPTQRLDLVGRVAYELDGDTYYEPHTLLYALRATQRLGARFDIGSEFQWIGTSNLGAYNRTGFAIETGYRLANSLRLAGGYNFEGSVDPSLAASPTRRGFYVTATTVIDRIFGWGDERR